MCEDVEKLVGAYVACRDHLAVVRKEFKTSEIAHKKDIDTLAQQIMFMAKKYKVESFKTAHGTAFKAEKDFIEVVDWDAALNYIIENDLKHLLSKSVGKAAVKEFMAENNNMLPPGLKYNNPEVINVRRK